MFSGNRYKLIFLLVFGVSLNSGCRKVLKPLNTAVRNTNSEKRYTENTFRRMGKTLGFRNPQKRVSLQKVDSLQKSYLDTNQKNVINRYNYLFNALNGKNALDALNWDKDKNKFYRRNKKYQRIRPQYEVFGWHPYWNKDNWKSYPLDLISTIAFFSYKINPETGSYTNRENIVEWKTTELIDSAKATKTKVLLSAACTGQKEVERFLTNQQSQSQFIDSIKKLIQYRNTDGVELHLEDIQDKHWKYYGNLIKQTSKRFRQTFSDRKVDIYVSVPPVLSKNAISVLQDILYRVDRIVVSGYQFNPPNGFSGSIAPLIDLDGKGSIEKSLQIIKDNFTNTNKFIFALPLYGSLWSGELQNSNTYSTGFDNFVTQKEVYIMSEDTQSLAYYSKEFDEQSYTNFFFFEYKDSTSHEFWFDDAYTTTRKMDAALDNGIKGVGFWALGYEAPDGILWDNIAERFSTDTLAIANPINEIKGYPFSVSAFLLKYKSILITSFCFLILFLSIALIITVSDQNFRNAMYRDYFVGFIKILILVSLFVPLFALIDFLNQLLLYIISFILGIAASFLLGKITFNFKQNRP